MTEYYVPVRSRIYPLLERILGPEHRVTKTFWDIASQPAQVKKVEDMLKSQGFDLIRDQLPKGTIAVGVKRYAT